MFRSYRSRTRLPNWFWRRLARPSPKERQASTSAGDICGVPQLSHTRCLQATQLRPSRQVDPEGARCLASMSAFRGNADITLGSQDVRFWRKRHSCAANITWFGKLADLAADPRAFWVKRTAVHLVTSFQGLGCRSCNSGTLVPESLMIPWKDSKSHFLVSRWLDYCGALLSGPPTSQVKFWN